MSDLPEMLLPPKKAAVFLGVSLSGFWLLTKEPDFPKKYKLSKRSVGWWLTDLKAWVLERNKELENGGM